MVGSETGTATPPIGATPPSDTVRLSGNVLSFGRPQTMAFLYDPARGSYAGGLGKSALPGALGGAVVQASDDPNGRSPTGAELALLAPDPSEALPSIGAYFDGGTSKLPEGSSAERYIGAAGNDVVVAGLGHDTLFTPSAGHHSFAAIPPPASGLPVALIETDSAPGGSLIPYLPDVAG